MGGQVWRVLWRNKRVITASIPGRQLALIAYHGWDQISHLVHYDRNVEADESTVLYAYKKRTVKILAMELMITVMLHKTDDIPWTEEELSPIKTIQLMDITLPTHLWGQR
jgi:hypothetical protein